MRTNVTKPHERARGGGGHFAQTRDQLDALLNLFVVFNVALPWHTVDADVANAHQPVKGVEQHQPDDDAQQDGQVLVDVRDHDHANAHRAAATHSHDKHATSATVAADAATTRSMQPHTESIVCHDTTSHVRTGFVITVQDAKT